MAKKPTRPANRTVPTYDSTGRRPPTQPRMPNQKRTPPGGGRVRKLR